MWLTQKCVLSVCPHASFTVQTKRLLDGAQKTSWTGGVCTDTYSMSTVYPAMTPLGTMLGVDIWKEYKEKATTEASLRKWKEIKIKQNPAQNISVCENNNVKHTGVWVFYSQQLQDRLWKQFSQQETATYRNSVALKLWCWNKRS